MSKPFRALIWASSLIAIAIAARFGLIDRGAATTLVIVLPVLAWLSISRGTSSCRVAGA